MVIREKPVFNSEKSEVIGRRRSLMKRQSVNAKSISDKLLWLGIGLGVFFWILESAIHTFIFHEGSLISQIFTADTNEIWMRLLVIALLIMFSVYAQLIINRCRQADEALRESEEKYRTFIYSSPDGVLITNLGSKKYVYANPSFCKLLGYSEGEIIGKTIVDLHPKDKLEDVISEFEAHVKGESELALDIPFLRKDGTEVHTDITGRLVVIGGEKCSMAFIRDITERKLAEEVSKKADALEITNVVLEKFISDALGNLIAPIYGRIQMIIGIRDNIDEIKSDLKDTETGLAEFLTGINAFREYFRFGERPMKERSSTDISHILSTLLSGQALETYGKDKFPIDPKVKLRFTYDPKQEGALDLKELPYVVGPDSEIATAIQETLINAIESYDPEKGGDVVISAKKEKDNLILEIADQGRGMSPDETEKSQLPFYKVLGVKGSTRFGLGAYVANESAKHCGGDIYIESTEGVGTTAYLLFKISDKPPVDM